MSQVLSNTEVISVALPLSYVMEITVLNGNISLVCWILFQTLRLHFIHKLNCSITAISEQPQILKRISGTDIPTSALQETMLVI